MTTPTAILIAAAIVGISILGAQFVAPYRIGGGADGTWRLNAITGEMVRCYAAQIPRCPE
jgi:hypothetical protein